MFHEYIPLLLIDSRDSIGGQDREYAVDHIRFGGVRRTNTCNEGTIPLAKVCSEISSFLHSGSKHLSCKAVTYGGLMTSSLTTDTLIIFFEAGSAIYK